MKPLLAVLLAGLAAAAASPSPAVAKDNCSLTARTPKILPNGEIRSAGWARCSRTVRRNLDIAYSLLLTSGKKLPLMGQGFRGRFRAGKRNGWGGSSSLACETITHERHRARYKDDLPVGYFVRLELYNYAGSKRLKRKDSHAVPLAELCPGFDAEAGSQPPAQR